MARETTRNNRWFKAVLVLTLSLAAWMPVKQAQAQMAVFDATLNTTTITQWIKELQSWMTQLSQIANLPSNFNFNSLLGNQLQKVDANSFAQKACPNSQGFAASMTGALGSLLNPDMTSNVAQSQYNVCLQIENLQADKYNKTVDVLNTVGSGFSSQIQKLEALREALKKMSIFGGSGSGNADQNAVTNQAQRTHLQLSAVMEKYKADIKADDSAISTLQQMQSVLGHIAMKGGNTVLGTVIQGAAFAAAFSN